MTPSKKPQNNLQLLAIHHTTFLVADLDRALEFYCATLGLETDPARPASMPFPGVWLNINKTQQIHLMRLPNPDPVTGRPEHGGRDRHAAYLVQDIEAICTLLETRGYKFTRSSSGRAAIFCRDPDGNALEFLSQ
jgi:glyoxylase I family protein